MAISETEIEPKIKKLEMVLNRSNMIIGMLEKTEVDTSSYKGMIEEAKINFENGKLEEAFRIAISCITELKGINESSEKKKNGKGSRGGRGKGVFALIRDNTQEMDLKIDEWKIIVSGWRVKGYNFEEDESLFSRSFDQIEKRFISIGEQIEKAEEIRSKIARSRDDFSHVGKEYLKKIDDIEKAVFRLDRLDDIDRRLRSVITTIRSVETRYRTLRNRISRHRRKGLNTSSIEEMIENDDDLDYLDKQLNIYESNIDFLFKEKQKLNTFKEGPFIDQFHDKIVELEKMIDDPWLLDKVVERMLDLEKSIKNAKMKDTKKEGERKRRNEIKKSLEKYSAEGFKIDMVEQIIDDDINLLEEEFDIFIRQTARLKSLKEKLFKLDATGFEDDVSSISEKLFDPTNINNTEVEVNELKNNILNQKIRSQNIENAVKEWGGMGFKISKLQNALQKDIVEAEKIYKDYTERISELMEYETRLKEVNHKDIPDLVHKLTLKIKNPELIDSIRKEMGEIQKVVSERDSIREKRIELNDLLKTWRSQGYKIDAILEKTQKETSIEGLEKIVLDHTRAIASLNSFKNEFPAFERGWFPDLEKEIMDSMNDPDLFKETLKKFTRLKKIVIKEEKRRGEISRKLTELSSRGIIVSRVSDLLIDDSKVLTIEYGTFKENVKRLLKLKTKLLREAHTKSDQELEMFAKGMNDPYQIEGYERQTSLREKGITKGSEEKATKSDLNEMKKKAKELYLSNDLQVSLELFKKVLAEDPDNKESSFYLKKVNLKLKNINEEGSASETSTELDTLNDDITPEDIEETTPVEDLQRSETSNSGDIDCLSCKGTGKCVWCNGSGQCSTCSGTGNTFGNTCPTCKGEEKCSVCKGSGKCSWCNL